MNWAAPKRLRERKRGGLDCCERAAVKLVKNALLHTQQL
jgi:hypothetical protein